MTNKIEDIRKWTGLPEDNHDEALWDAGFNLDDWDVCFASDKCLTKSVTDGRGKWWQEPIDEAWWLYSQMENYCVGFTEIEYNGRWYYTVHHA